MKPFQITPLVLAAMMAAHAPAQNVSATAVADALDDLKQATLDKIDSEVEINARAFADAKNIQSSLVWGDWFRPILDIAMEVYDGLTAISVLNPNSARTWLGTTIQGAGAAKGAVSILGSLDRLKQDGTTLALDLDGPAYNSLVSAMLDRADATGPIFFDYTSYKQSVVNDLYGTVAANCPIRVAHKSTSVDRTGGDIFPTLTAARSYIANQLGALSSLMRQSQLPPDRIATLVGFIQARKLDALQSRVGPTRITYQACLTSGTTVVWRPVAYSLGTITQLEQWRGKVLDLFVQSAGFDSIGITGRFLEKVGDFVLDQSLDAATETVNLNLSVEAVMAGQASANQVLKDATSLGISVAKPDIGALADAAQSYVSSSREQIDLIPAQMMDALPGEVSKLLLLADDTVKYTQVTASTPSGPTITQQPQDQTAAVGQTATFSVVATGAGTPTYQWRRNGVDIPSATSASCTTSPVSFANDGYTYQVVVTDSQGSTPSRIATLNVVDSATPCPDPNEPNDSSLTATPLAFGVAANGYVCTATDVDWFRVDVATPGVLTFDLTVPAANDYDLELYGPDAAYITGSYNDTGLAEHITWNATVTGTYYVRVYGYPAGNGSHNATVPYTLTAGFSSGPVTILTPPADRTVPAGASASFSVTATGAPPLAYQWQRDGVDIPGATGPNYATPALTLADSGA